MTEEIEWEPIYDYENESPWVRPNRPWFKYRPSTVPKTIKFEPIAVHDWIRNIVKDYPNNVAIYYTPKDKKITYREIFWNADKLANALYNDLGVKMMQRKLLFCKEES